MELRILSKGGATVGHASGREKSAWYARAPGTDCLAPGLKRRRHDVDERGEERIVPDIAIFIFEAASQLARSREALRRNDSGMLRASVLALGHASAAAGADRMFALCGNLRSLVEVGDSLLETALDAIADEFDLIAGDLHTVRSA
jgi:hypothetical protein